MVNDEFELNTGIIVGALPSCQIPNDLDYHSLCDEIWIPCYAPNKEGSYLDVVSASGIIDRLVGELGLIPTEAYLRLRGLIKMGNAAAAASMFNSNRAS